jgi:hypothetical protein
MCEILCVDVEQVEGEQIMDMEVREPHQFEELNELN